MRAEISSWRTPTGLVVAGDNPPHSQRAAISPPHMNHVHASSSTASANPACHQNRPGSATPRASSTRLSAQVRTSKRETDRPRTADRSCVADVRCDTMQTTANNVEIPDNHPQTPGRLQTLSSHRVRMNPTAPTPNAALKVCSLHATSAHVPRVRCPIRPIPYVARQPIVHLDHEIPASTAVPVLSQE